MRGSPPDSGGGGAESYQLFILKCQLVVTVTWNIRTIIISQTAILLHVTNRVPENVVLTLLSTPNCSATNKTCLRRVWRHFTCDEQDNTFTSLMTLKCVNSPVIPFKFRCHVRTLKSHSFRCKRTGHWKSSSEPSVRSVDVVCNSKVVVERRIKNVLGGNERT